MTMADPITRRQTRHQPLIQATAGAIVDIFCNRIIDRMLINEFFLYYNALGVVTACYAGLSRQK